LIHDKAIEAASELAEEIELFCTRTEVELFILFGSQARCVPHTGSDMDIALQFAPRQEPSKLQLTHGLEMMLMPKTVDLSYLPRKPIQHLEQICAIYLFKSTKRLTTNFMQEHPASDQGC